jgi:hypothetical protein
VQLLSQGAYILKPTLGANKRLAFAGANVLACAHKMTSQSSDRPTLMLNKADPPSDKKEPVVIKKYANRRLYNTETSTYVTLDDLAAMVKANGTSSSSTPRRRRPYARGADPDHRRPGEPEARRDAAAHPFLRTAHRFYGASIERFVPSYLQASLESLAKEQERFRKQFAGAFTPAGAFEAYQEQARKNLGHVRAGDADVLAVWAQQGNSGAKPGEETKEARGNAQDRTVRRDRGAQGAARHHPVEA